MGLRFDLKEILSSHSLWWKASINARSFHAFNFRYHYSDCVAMVTEGISTPAKGTASGDSLFPWQQLSLPPSLSLSISFSPPFKFPFSFFVFLSPFVSFSHFLALWCPYTFLPFHLSLISLFSHFNTHTSLSSTHSLSVCMSVMWNLRWTWTLPHSWTAMIRSRRTRGVSFPSTPPTSCAPGSSSISWCDGEICSTFLYKFCHWEIK